MLSSTSGTAHAVQQQQQQQPARDAHAPPPRGAKRPRDVADAAGVDPLFERYGDLEIHEELLRDAARTAAYRDAIARADMAGKTVLEVGCGTGVLACLCAAAGAAHVVAVEANARVGRLARAVARASGFGADVVSVVAGARVEDLAAGALPARA